MDENMSSYTSEVKQKLTALVRACGTEIINQAEDIVGDCDAVTDLSIWVRVTGNDVPTIEVSKERVCKQAIKVLYENT